MISNSISFNLSKREVSYLLAALEILHADLEALGHMDEDLAQISALYDDLETASGRKSSK